MKKRVLILIPVLLVLVGLIVFGIYYTYHRIPLGKMKASEPADSVVIDIPTLYGISLDSFNIEEGRIKPNQTLGNLLKAYNLPEGAFQALLTIPSDTFDLRKVRAGNKFVLFFDKDTSRTLRYFVYEHTLVDYNMVCFFDSVWATNGRKKVDVVRQHYRGKIETSLWNAMTSANINPMLANDLSDIYAWSIDFFGLQVGDSFSVVCDEEFVDTISLGCGKIHAAYFRHAEKDFYAVPFVQNQVESYFDLEGNSLRKAFLKAPLRFSRISSGFSHSRLHPVLKIHRPHHGVDYAAPAGTPVYAIGDGKIIAADYGYNKGGGNSIKIRHNSVYTTAYLHLKGFAKGIKAGIYVKQGDLIGYVGSTGLSTGPHLDFRFYKNGHPVNPLSVEAPPVEPILEENKSAFDSVKVVTLNLLKNH
ncbi:MAG: peptidoglycan DD-metalloendopeptidase family protein [Bacteroidota bacterium]|nr:MAG: peptidoglycan DD-metalloendopeptidase family protein [Bacteroidota bacterium]